MVKLLVSIISQKSFFSVALITLIAYVLIYLFAIQYLTFTSDIGEEESLLVLKIIPNWQELLFKQRAPFLFEAIGTLYLGDNLKVFISVPNIAIATMLGGLVAVNVSTSYYSFKMLGLKGVRGISSLLGTIPAIVSGAACCVPTLILVIGLQLTATIVTIWSFFVPLSAILLFLSLLWSLRRIQNKKMFGL